ncbi:hypothetical protein KIN20_024371 [Parelaphostrongylus tenuis]|uniref:Uncharacterized protein n=1 Tax=Parelaphostrongylus tenuis TaxID=148309 RepID=A0AAD5MTF0_PARTN|nr:hypothetical protein KIN20_024371 [Parelaphostrongylus tenuis]
MPRRGSEQDCISIGSEVESVQTGQVGSHESLVRQDSCASDIVTEELFSTLKEESDSLDCSVTYSEESYGSKRRCTRMELYRQVCAAMEQNTDPESNTLATQDYWMELLK